MRKIVSLNGVWNFQIDTSECRNAVGKFNVEASPTILNRREGGALADSICWTMMPVPSCWNTHSAELRFYEGQAWYYREFDCPARSGNETGVIRFGAINYLAEIFLNGNKVGEHEGGYTQFDIDVTRQINWGGRNSLAVKVNNSKYRHRVPPFFFGWFNYGGIYRDVSLLILDEMYFDKVVLTAGLGKTEAVLHVSLAAKNKVAKRKIKIIVEILDGEGEKVTQKENEFPMAKGNSSLNIDVVVPGVRLWHTEDPYLYTVCVSLWSHGKKCDEYVAKFGFRTVELKDGKLMLNGERLFLRGINVHSDYPLTGRSLDQTLFETDLKLFKELNVNALRLAHYPHDEKVIEKCDELGFLVWSEIPAYWGINVEDKSVFSLAENQLIEMVNRDINHPSIIIWSVGNETITTTEKGRSFFKKLIRTAREIDPTRLITYADGSVKDVCHDLVDIVSINAYHGWYSGPSPEEIDVSVEDGREGRKVKVSNLDLCHFEERVESVYKLSGGKPIIISEFGAGAQFGYRSFDRRVWSEDYQAHLLEEHLSLIQRKPHVIGTFPWLFADFPDPSRENNIWQNGFNNKGIVDYYRRKKLAFDVVAKAYRKIKKRMERRQR